MPPLPDYVRLLERIWDSGWLTNRGQLHQEFERRLARYLAVEHISVVCNGTTALQLALRAFDIDGGKVITSPFTFPATAHVISWLGAEPVFCDIDPVTLNLDPSRLQDLIDSETRAILPVHVYGTPCDVEGIREVASEHRLPVIYDAAHAFGVGYRGRALTAYGDASVLSFHATKLFSTAEGGAVVIKSAALKRDLDHLMNFGIADAENVIMPGINGKMNELQAAYGLLRLDSIQKEISDRRQLADVYRSKLEQIPGIDLMSDVPGTRQNHGYFPILVGSRRFGMGRDQLHEALAELNIHTRKYFYPLCSHYPHYRSLPSSAPEHLPVAEAATRRILCLPIYGSLAMETVRHICTAISRLHRLWRAA